MPGLFFRNPPQHLDSDLERWTAYGYYHYQVAEPLRLVAGVAYDQLTLPRNFRFAPVASGHETQRRLLPKAGLVWTPLARTDVRVAYSQSLGGVSLDQSFQLEPTQVAGLNQSWRSLIPESVAGANAGAKFETLAFALNQKLFRDTYLGLTAQLLRSKVDRTIGVYEFAPPFTGEFIRQSTTREKLEFEERSIAAGLQQLLGDRWTVGLGYALSQAELQDRFSDIAASALQLEGFVRESDLKATLHQANVFALYQHPCGFFAPGPTVLVCAG